MSNRVKQIRLDIVLDKNAEENILNELIEYLNMEGYWVIGSDERDITDLYDDYDINGDGIEHKEE